MGAADLRQGMEWRGPQFLFSVVTRALEVQLGSVESISRYKADTLGESH